MTATDITPGTPCDTADAYRFAVTTGTGMRALVIYNPDDATVQIYDRRYAGQPGFTEHGQRCGGPQSASDFHRDATTGIRGWHDVDHWDMDARTVRLIGAWLHVSGFTTEEN